MSKCKLCKEKLEGGFLGFGGKCHNPSCADYYVPNMGMDGVDNFVRLRGDRRPKKPAYSSPSNKVNSVMQKLKEFIKKWRPKKSLEEQKLNDDEGYPNVNYNPSPLYDEDIDSGDIDLDPYGPRPQYVFKNTKKILREMLTDIEVPCSINIYKICNANDFGSCINIDVHCLGKIFKQKIKWDHDLSDIDLAQKMMLGCKVINNDVINHIAIHDIKFY